MAVEALFASSRAVASGMAVSTLGAFDIVVRLSCMKILVNDVDVEVVAERVFSFVLPLTWAFWNCSHLCSIVLQ